MNKSQFVEIVKNPDLVSDQTLSDLKEIIEEYPFFQIGRMLLLKNLHKLDNIRYNSELKQSAVYIADRNQLFALINNIKKPTIEEETFNDDIQGHENKSGIAEEIITSSYDHPSSAHAETKASVSDNYLNASDEFTGDDGNTYNFSAKKRKDEPKENERLEFQNIVLPAADLLDYEISTSTGYSLPKLTEIENLDTDENKSFSDWLHVMRYSSAQPKNENPTENPRGMNLIDNFLNSKHQIIAASPGKLKEVDLSEEKQSNQEDILSETLADIYVKQGHKNKAISIFEKLLLKYPEKNVYFARRIKELKEN